MQPSDVVKFGPEDFQRNIRTSRTCLDMKTNHSSILLTARFCGALKQLYLLIALVSCNSHLHAEFLLRVCLGS